MRTTRWHEVLKFTEVFMQMMEDRGLKGGYTDIKKAGVYYRNFYMEGSNAWKRMYPVHQKVHISNLHGELPLVYSESHKKLAFALEAGKRVGNMFPQCHLAQIDPAVKKEDAMAIIAQRALEGYVPFGMAHATPFQRIQDRLKSTPPGDPEIMKHEEGFDMDLCRRELAKHPIEKRTFRIICHQEELFLRLKKALGIPEAEDVTEEPNRTMVVTLPVFSGEKELEAVTQWEYDGSAYLLRSKSGALDELDEEEGTSSRGKEDAEEDDAPQWPEEWFR